MLDNQMIKDLIINNIKRGLIAFLVLFPLLSAYIYFSTIHSEEYLTAEKYVEMNPEIKAELGEVIDTSLALRGIKISHLGSSGTARFTLNANGTKAKAKIWFFLLKKDGVWLIKEVKILN